MSPLHQPIGISGRVKLAVRQGDQVVRSYPWQENLILDQGKDMIATTLFNQLFAALHGRQPNGSTVQGSTVMNPPFNITFNATGNGQEIAETIEQVARGEFY
jgi:hypothetical protein